MYASYPSLILGFHGCDQEVGEDILSGKAPLLPSRNDFDWLGDGIYFWENDPDRALDFASWRAISAIPSLQPIKNPFVIGAVIHPGRCFNLLERRAISMLKDGYNFLKSAASEVLPKTNH